MALKLGQDLSVLAGCTRLSTVALHVQANPMDSWQGLVTGLCKIFSHFSSPVIRSIQVEMQLKEPDDALFALAHPDSEFWTIDLGLIHDLMKRPMFDSLQDVTIDIPRYSTDVRLARDAVLTAEETNRRLCLILEPWDKRGILTVRGDDEPTDEELGQEADMNSSNSKKEDPSGGVKGEEALSPEDEAVPA
ncbi:hypothetical protein FOMPIDRAFT_87384 [Fomitopsis schrenkii]|uniref:Uncharacterized protein n=1 Tax=Fomitopsis schrenkii TaxID=2126942 RepID=S8EGG8_FOMSC|nr:hypothetical protein FOMPIDRAFT_87384 [Fomitopsis schrenkii]